MTYARDEFEFDPQAQSDGSADSAGPDGGEVVPFPDRFRRTGPDDGQGEGSIGVGVPRPADPDRVETPGSNPDTGHGEDADALDPGPDELPVPVDSAEAQRDTRPAWDRAEWRPVLPGWARSMREARTAAGWLARYLGHETAYHAVRLPKYTSRLVWWAPRGLWRALRAWAHWLLDLEGRPVRLAAVRSEDAKEYRALLATRDRHVRWRGIVTTVAAVAIVAGLAALLWVAPSAGVWQAPDWSLWAAGTATVAGLGLAGKPADRPLLDTAVVVQRAAKLTSSVVKRAFEVAGLSTEKAPITFPQPIQRDGEGWRAVVDLPYGKTFADALRNADRLASGIDIAATQVFLDPDPTTSRRAVMWVADTDPLAQPAGKTPLLKVSQVDMWEAFPIGLDERGSLVRIDMLWNSLLVGAVPRQGKTFTARLIALAAALDPYVRLYVYDGKGSPDWRGFAKVAHRCGFGLMVDRDGDPAERLLADLRELKADAEDRYARLSELPKHLCPEGKLTRQLARNRNVNMPLTLLMVDEVQEYLTHPEYGKQILELLVYLVKVAPAVGIMVVDATQKPDDKACPSVFRDQHQGRISLRVGSWQVSEVILGQGSYSEGLDASRLLPSHKGVGILRGLPDRPGIVRFHLADGQDAEKILDRARALREQAGTLTGTAVGERPDVGPDYDLLADLLAVMPSDQSKAWSETLLAALAELRPTVYAGWEPEQLTAALKPHGVRTQQVWGTDPTTGQGANRRGVRRDDLVKAVTERDRNRKSRRTE